MLQPDAQLVYEGDCALCRSAAHWIAAHAAGSIEIVPFGDSRVPSTLDADRSRVHWVNEDGVLHGGAAMTQALRRIRGGRLARVLDLPLLTWVRDAGYRVVARTHRGRVRPPVRSRR
ncbi:MAG: DCC1-like thiol-disulfide oxidoreductase family protein [Dehalococcoidia bacterium]